VGLVIGTIQSTEAAPGGARSPLILRTATAIVVEYEPRDKNPDCRPMPQRPADKERAPAPLCANGQAEAPPDPQTAAERNLPCWSRPAVYRVAAPPASRAACPFPLPATPAVQGAGRVPCVG